MSLLLNFRPMEGRYRSTHFSRDAERTLCGLDLAKMRPHRRTEGERECKACRAALTPESTQNQT